MLVSSETGLRRPGAVAAAPSESETMSECSVPQSQGLTRFATSGG